jgi:small subunit ribosomal protein S4
MKVGPKYKIARRLGRSVFEKTQTAKFALSAEKKNANVDGMRSRSNYGTQLLEKQKVRFTYGITNKQLGKYAYQVIDSKVKNQEEMLYISLEKRLDNVVLISGFATSRRHARQLVSHGHVKVNGGKNKVPSYSVKKGDVIEIKESSRDKAVFQDLEERVKDINIPSWIKVDHKNFKTTIENDPVYNSKETHFNLGEVLQFYKR